MKKYLIIIIALFILTGCTNISELSYDDVIEKALNETSHKNNTFLEGYKLYIPEHMTLIGDLNGNEILYSYGDKYYLYVDIVSFYNKKQNKYNVEKQSYVYSKDIDHNNLSGYVTLNKAKGGYLLEVMYNYAKIEVVTNDIKKALANSILVLKNIEYNYKIIDTMVGTNAITYDSELFELLGPKKKNDNFLEYIEEYGEYDKKSAEKDEDMINAKSAD